MFRKPEDAPQGKQSVNCLLTDGGIGDHLCSLVAIDYIIRNHPWINLLIWLPEHMVEFAKNVLPPDSIVRGYTEGHKKYNDKLYGITTRWDGRSSPMRISPIDYSFHMLVDMHTDDLNIKSYLKLNLDKIDITRFSLPEKYVTIPAFASETVKRLPGNVINKIADYVKNKGYTPVFIGAKEAHTGYKDIKVKAELSEGVDLTKGIDLTNQTSLTEVGKIIAQAAVYIGMDSGITHVAGFTDTNIISGYSFADYKYLAPIRNGQLYYKFYPVVPNDDLGCRFCQTKQTFVYRDFRECYYDDYLCISQLTFEKFKEQIDKVI